jgi:hypothetical protein
MTLQSSGPIDFGQINTELGYPANTQISLNDTAVRTLAGVPSGAIGAYTLYGKKYVYIPAGLIIMVTDNIIPSGWINWSGSGSPANLIARNDITTRVVPQNCFSSTPTTYVTTSSAGSHLGSVHPSPFLVKSGTTSYRGLAVAGGAHTHNSLDPNIAYWYPNSIGLKFIKASTNLSYAPANGMFFGTSAIPGFSIYNSSYYPMINCFYLNYFNMGSMYGLGDYNTGNHTHTTSKTANNSDGSMTNWETACPSSSSQGCGTYSMHSLSAVVTSSFYTILMRGLYKTASYNIEPGLIGMWEGTTAPVGWSFCDGTNGTIDMADYCIKFSTTGTGTKSGTQSDTVVNFSVTLSVGSDTFTHTHTQVGYGYDILDNGTLASYRNSATASHTHTITTPIWSAKNFKPCAQYIKFIQYKGV